MADNIARYVPHVAPDDPDPGVKGLQVLQAISDGSTHFLRVAFRPPFPGMYSISAVSPARNRHDHEVFVGEKARFRASAMAWKIWMPALYPDVEVRVGVGSPMELAGPRTIVRRFDARAVPPPPGRQIKPIYIVESNVPKRIPSEIGRFFIHPLRVTKLSLAYFTHRSWQGADFWNYSVINGLPLPNISYAIIAECGRHHHTMLLDRQFGSSRDEILMIAAEDCGGIRLTLKAVTLAHVGVAKRGGLFEFGVAADQVTVLRDQVQRSA